MKTYITKDGDMWDVIAKQQLGGTQYTGKLLMANLKYNSYFKFPAGIVLIIPDIDKSEAMSTPPWKAVNG